MVNIKSQSESASQVDVLLTLYKLRVTVLDCTKELRDYRSTQTHKRAFRPEDLTLLASNTRTLLHDAFHKRFFARYSDRKVMNKCSFVLEAQLFLHPNFKNFDGFLKKIVVLCNSDQTPFGTGGTSMAGERNFSTIKKKIYSRVRSILLAVAATPAQRMIPVVDLTQLPPAMPTLFSEDLLEHFGDIIDDNTAEPDTIEDVNGTRIDEELERWEATPTSIQAVGYRPETVLEFWKRQEDNGTFKYLPLAARILFSVPSSSAQIERDFGTAGRLVTPQRGSIAAHNVDMSAFLNCNRQFVDVTQCPKIRDREIDTYIPSNVRVGLEDDDEEGCALMSRYFSLESDIDEDAADREA